MKLFSLVTLFAHYFITIDGGTSVSYRSNARNRRSAILYTKEMVGDPDTSLPKPDTTLSDPLLQGIRSKFQAQDINSKEVDLVSLVKQKNSKSIFLNPDIRVRENKSAKVMEGKGTLIDKEKDPSKGMKHKGLINESGVAREDYNRNKSSIKIQETALNSFNLSHSSKTPANNSEKSFRSSPLSTEHESAPPNDGSKRRLGKTEKGNLISSILGGKSSLELTRSKNGVSSKNRKTNKVSPTKLEKSRRAREENAIEECQHAITSSRDKWSQFCKLLFLLQAENVNKVVGKTSSRGTNEEGLDEKGQNITRMKESPRSNLPKPKSQYKTPKTQAKLSSFQPYEIELDSDSQNLKAQKSTIAQLANEESLQNKRKMENRNSLEGIKTSSFREKFQLDSANGRIESQKQTKVLPQNLGDSDKWQIEFGDKSTSKIDTHDYNKIDSYFELNKHVMQTKHNYNVKEEKLNQASNFNNSLNRLSKISHFDIKQNENIISNTTLIRPRATQKNDENVSNTINLDQDSQIPSTEEFITTEQSNIAHNKSPKAEAVNHKNELKINLKKSADVSQNKTMTNLATTLPSVFRENLIPPLPQKWPENDAEELWTDLDRQELEQNFSLNDDELYSNKEDEYANDTKTNEKFHKENTSQTYPVAFEKISFIGRDASQNLSEEKYRTSDADYDEYILESPTTDLKNRSKQLKEAIPTVRIAGKADMSDAPMPNAKERIRFITVPPGTHWHLWGGFPGRRRVDPIFEMGRANVTGDVSQMYTAYWGSNPDGSSFLTGIWILRIGAGVGLLTLVLTVAAQTVRFCQPLLSQKAVLTTNLSTSLAAAHVVFIFGIQATEGLWICGVVALFLHFLYLLTCNWILALSIRLLRRLLQKKPFHTAVYCVPVWIASLAVIVVSYGLNPSGYETRRFCWLSIERGMLFAFIGPVCTLLLANAGVCIACQKILLDPSVHRDSNDKNDLRVGVSLLPLHGVAWFLTVVALEDDLSLALDCAAALATAAVGCLTLHFYVPDWQDFLYLYLPCPLPSTPENKSLIPIAMATTLENPNLPLTEVQLSQPSSTTYSLSSSSSTTALLEEHQLDCVYSSGYRREAY